MNQDFSPSVKNLHVLQCTEMPRVAAYIREDGLIALFNAPDIARVLERGGELFPETARDFTSVAGLDAKIFKELQLLSGKRAEDLRVHAALFGHPPNSTRVRIDLVEQWKLGPGGEIQRLSHPLTDVPEALDDAQDALLLRSSVSAKNITSHILSAQPVQGGYLSGISQYKRLAAALQIGSTTLHFDLDELQRLSTAEAYTAMRPDHLEIQIGGATVSLSQKAALKMRSAAALMLAEHNGCSMKLSPLDLSRGDITHLAKLVTFASTAVNVARAGSAMDEADRATLAELVAYAEATLGSLEDISGVLDFVAQIAPAASVPAAALIPHLLPFRDSIKDALAYGKHALIEKGDEMIRAQRSRA